LVESNETYSIESENAKMAGENNVHGIFYAKCIIHQEFVLQKQAVKVEFTKRQ
jgi:hypothetical protein